jgi:hypothetical protein
MRVAQIKHYCESKNISLTKVISFQFSTANDLVSKLNNLREEVIDVIEFFLLAHSRQDRHNENRYGIDCETSILHISELRESCDKFFRPNLVYISHNWVICNSNTICIPNLDGNGYLDRLFGDETNTRGSIVYRQGDNVNAVTLNIKKDDGGWIHSGLNPEVLNDDFISELFRTQHMRGCTLLKYNNS